MKTIFSVTATMIMGSLILLSASDSYAGSREMDVTFQTKGKTAAVLKAQQEEFQDRGLLYELRQDLIPRIQALLGPKQLLEDIKEVKCDIQEKGDDLTADCRANVVISDTD